MSQQVFQHHLDLTSLVTVLAFVLDLFNERPNHTVGHVGWHGLAAGGAVLHSFLARSANDMTCGAAGYWKVSGNVKTNRTLQLGLHLGHSTCHGMISPEA